MIDDDFSCPFFDEESPTEVGMALKDDGDTLPRFHVGGLVKASDARVASYMSAPNFLTGAVILKPYQAVRVTS